MLKKRANSIQKALLILTFVVFPFGQIIKLPFDEVIKISLLDVLVLLYILLDLFRVKRKVYQPLLYKSGLLFLLVSLLSLLINYFRLPQNLLFQGFSYLIRFSVYLFFYFEVCRNIKNQKDYIKLVDFGLLTSGIFVAIFGILQYFLYPDLRNLLYLGWDPHYYRLFSTFFDPNFTGIILTLIFFQFIFVNYPKQVFIRIIYFLSFLTTVSALILTRSRSAFISLFTGLLFLLFTFKKIRNELLIGIFLSIAIFLILPKPHVDVSDFFRSTSTIARINNWRQSILLGFKSPVLGSGFGTIRFADSSFLYIFATTGFLGLITYLLIWKRIVILGRNNYKVLLISAVVFISSWFNNTFFYPWVLYWFLLFLAKEETGQGS